MSSRFRGHTKPLPLSGKEMQKYPYSWAVTLDCGWKKIDKYGDCFSSHKFLKYIKNAFKLVNTFPADAHWEVQQWKKVNGKSYTWKRYVSRNEWRSMEIPPIEEK